MDEILKLRKGIDSGDTCVRPYKIPKTFNLNAHELKELIDWEKEKITEPSLTAHMTVAELQLVKQVPLTVRKFSLHTQSCERAVKLVSEASASVAGQKKRHGFIKQQISERKKMGSLRVKRKLSDIE